MAALPNGGHPTRHSRSVFSNGLVSHPIYCAAIVAVVVVVGLGHLKHFKHIFHESHVPSQQT